MPTVQQCSKGFTVEVNERKSRRRRVESTFGKNLKATMQRRNLTHATVAEMAGVSVSTINDWVSGTIPHDLQRVGMLAQRLGVSFRWILLGADEDYREPTLADFFDELPADHLTGLYRIEARRLVPKGKQ